MRTRNSALNVLVGLVGQLGVLLMQFICRSIFIKKLGLEYLGLTGFFSNVLGMLALAEMGIGASVLFSLYRPIAQGDERKICALLNFHRRLYYIVAGVVLGIGCLFFPFCIRILKGYQGIEYIVLIYILYMFVTISSYFLAYKQLLLEAYQKKYICSAYSKTILIFQNVLQILFLYLTGNFIVYLLIQCATVLITNILLSRKANQLYPFILQNKKEKLNKNEKIEIYKNTGATALHRLSGLVISSTDNIVMTVFATLSSVGIYTNYILITGTINIFLDIIASSFTASIGNFVESQRDGTIYGVYKVLNYIMFWFVGYAAVAFFLLANVFMRIWLGNGFSFSGAIVLVLAINVYVQGLRKGVIVFRDGMGLFNRDKLKAVCEAALNIIISIILVQKMGVIGIILGTLLSTLFTGFWVEPWVVYRRGFNQNPTRYFIRYAVQIAICLLCGYGAWWTQQFVNGDTVWGLLLKGILITIVYNGLFLIITWILPERCESFGYAKKLINRRGEK